MPSGVLQLLGIYRWRNRRHDKAGRRIGSSCADAMIDARSQVLRQIGDGAVESAVNILTISRRKDWSVETSGDLFYRNQYINKMTRLDFEKLVGVVLAVETIARLGVKGAGRIGTSAHSAARESLAKVGLASPLSTAKFIRRPSPPPQ